MQTIENLRKRLVTEGFELALEGKKRRDAADAAQARWRRRSEADRHAVGQAARRLRTLDVATARRRTGGLGSGRFDQSRDGPQDAKKNGMTKRKIEYWVIPPEQDAEFVACMEEVLETYAEAYDPQHPVLCMDEQPVQLLKETRVPIAATKKHGKRVDYEYERNGTASIFMFAEPLSGFRQATARERRTKVDWAIEVAQMLDTRYADLREGDAGVRQPQHAHQRGVLRGVRTGASAGVHQADQLLLHAETRQLAECRRMRVELPDEPVSERPPHRRTDRTANRNRGSGPTRPTPNNAASTGNSASKTPA